MYEINSKKVSTEWGECESYGITYANRKIEDISTDKKSVEKLIENVNLLEISPIHIDDVIEDFLAS